MSNYTQSFSNFVRNENAKTIQEVSEKSEERRKEIERMARAMDEGFAESERDLKDKKTPLDQPTQNDWAKRFDELFDYRHYGDQNEKWASILDRKDYNPASPEQIKDFIRKELADARREVIIDRIDRLKLYEVIENIYLSGMYTHDKGILRQYMSDIINVLATLKEEHAK